VQALIKVAAAMASRAMRFEIFARDLSPAGQFKHRAGGASSDR